MDLKLGELKVWSELVHCPHHSQTLPLLHCIMLFCLSEDPANEANRSQLSIILCCLQKHRCDTDSTGVCFHHEWC